MKKNQKAALDKVLVHEGGYSNHPRDPGGATMKGVTQRVYDDYRRSENLATRSVQKITPDELLAIYDRRYWDLIKGDDLPSGVDYVVFDGAVNSGPGQSVKWLQRALGVKVDGLVGPATLAAIEAHPDHDALIDAICNRRMAFLKALKTWPTFGKGWSRRVADVRNVGKAWADGKLAPEIVPTTDPIGKAPVESAAPPPSTAPGDGATGAGGILVILTQAINQLREYSDLFYVPHLIVGLTVAGVVITAGGLAYRFWARRKAVKIADALDLPEAVA